MGFDGLISFLIRNLPNDTFDEVNLIKNYNKVLSKHILVDISFILYNCYIEMENDINLILKYIYIWNRNISGINLNHCYISYCCAIECKLETLLIKNK